MRSRVHAMIVASTVAASIAALLALGRLLLQLLVVRLGGRTMVSSGRLAVGSRGSSRAARPSSVVVAVGRVEAALAGATLKASAAAAHTRVSNPSGPSRSRYSSSCSSLVSVGRIVGRILVALGIQLLVGVVILAPLQLHLESLLA